MNMLIVWNIGQPPPIMGVVYLGILGVFSLVGYYAIEVPGRRVITRAGNWAAAGIFQRKDLATEATPL